MRISGLIAGMAVLFFVFSCHAEDNKPEIPLTIDDVQTWRINRQLVRYVHHNRLALPKFIVELMSVPKRSLLDRINIDRMTIQVDGKDRVLEFYDQSSVEFQNLKPGKDELSYNVEYISGERGGGYYLVACTIKVDMAKLDGPVCRLIRTEMK